MTSLARSAERAFLPFLRKQDWRFWQTHANLHERSNLIAVSGVKTVFELPDHVTVKKLAFVKHTEAAVISTEQVLGALASDTVLLDGRSVVVPRPVREAEGIVQVAGPEFIQEVWDLGRSKGSAAQHELRSGVTDTRIEHLLDLMALVELPLSRWPLALPRTPVRRTLILHNLQDPGNIGSLIRSAVALGFTEIWPIMTSGQRLDPRDRIVLNAKAVRASKGAIVHARIMRADLQTCLAYLVRHQVQTFVADMPQARAIKGLSFSGGMPPDLNKPLALILSNEGKGVSNEIPSVLPRVGLAMRKPVQSLNVAAAGAALMYALQG